MASVLVVDDEPNIRRMVGALLAAEGYEVRDEADGKSGLRAIEDYEPDVVLIDLMMPGELDGMSTLARIRERWSELPVVMMSGRASLGDAVRATKLGAVNFLEKPLAPETVLLALSSALELRHARRAARALRAELGRTGEMVGSSPAMARVRELIARVAPSDARVLIDGESGTGKELVAAALHEHSPRRDRPFVRVNCAAIPRDLVESEMFGHEKGAFTGAAERRIGKFELADTGTLFLDEIGDLTVEAQAKLLRAIEAKEIQRVGGNKTIRVDVRVVAATNRDLSAAVADGSFREDLFFRLNVIPVRLPPLRERGNDVLELVQHFSEVQHQRTGRPTLAWSDDALARMRSYGWPGNVRELANIVERIAILSNDAHVGVGDVGAVLPPPRESAAVVPPASEERGLTDALDDAERTMIADALSEAAGNMAEAARRLKTDRANLYRRMRRLGMAAIALIGMTISRPGVARAQSEACAAADSSCASAVTVHPSLRVSSGKTYNRVEGLPLLFGPGLTVEGSRVALDGAAYAVLRTGRSLRTSEPDAGHDVRVSARFGPDKSLGLDLGLYDLVAPIERWQMSEPEQGLAAFLLRRDYLDYFDRHGASARLAWGVNEKATLFAQYARERWRSIGASNPFTLFRENGHWRRNPLVDEGVFDLLSVGGTFDTRNDERNPSGGWLINASYEYGRSDSASRAAAIQGATPAFGAPERVSYGRGFVDIRRYNRISPRTELDGRVVAGGRLHGDELPLERRMSLGGPGTMPGFDFRERQSGPDVLTCTSPGTVPVDNPALCDRAILGQLDFRAALAAQPFDILNIPMLRLRRVGFTAQPVGVLFTDWGRGWRSDTPWSSHIKGDVGAGLDLGLVGFYFAKAITDSKEPANFFVRIRRRY